MLREHNAALNLFETKPSSECTKLEEKELLIRLMRRTQNAEDLSSLSECLIDRFGSFSRVVNAETFELASLPGMSPQLIADLQLVALIAQKMTEPKIFSKNILANWEKVVGFCRVRMGHLKHEELNALFLDAHNNLSSVELVQRGTLSFIPCRPREIVSRALELGASKLVVVHNHPSGEVSPSEADVRMTQMLIEAMQLFDIELLDHLIISSSADFSFRSSGLMSRIKNFECWQEFV
jgi:DNA repair protein RadC